MLRYKLSYTEPYDIIITSDDNALNFALEHRAELFPTIPIVFLGVNDLQQAHAMNDEPLVTGVVEAISARDVTLNETTDAE